MLRDAEFFRSRLSKLDGAGDIGDYIVSIVNAKTVAEQPAPAQPILAPVSTPSEAATTAGPTAESKPETVTKKETKS